MEQAVKDKDIDTISQLLQEGHDPNSIHDGVPLIFINQDPSVVKLLIQFGANPNSKDEFGFTIQDYSELPIEMPTNIEPSVKFVQYRGTRRERTPGRAKTRRMKRPDESL
jgi:hypothetical protein